MAGQLVAFTPKKVGRSVRPGRSCATVESGKWVGPAKLASGGEVLEINDAPYTDGWVLKVRPEDWDGVKPQLVTGDAVAPAYEAKMRADEFAGCEAVA